MFARISVCALVGLLLIGQVSATVDDWAVVQALAAGVQVQVALVTGKRVTGKLDHVTSDSIFVRSGKKVTEVPQKEVRRLHLIKRGNWMKPTFIGMGVGAAAGVGIGAGIMEREEGYAGAVAGTTALFCRHWNRYRLRSEVTKLGADLRTAFADSLMQSRRLSAFRRAPKIGKFGDVTRIPFKW